MMRRVGGLLYVSDRKNGDAKKEGGQAGSNRIEYG